MSAARLQHPLSSGMNPHSCSTPQSESDLPDRYWFDPRSNRVVISPLAPSADAELVLANIVPGEAPLDVRKVLLIYARQQEDNCNRPAQKNICPTKESREKKGKEYENQIPVLHLKDVYPNVEFRKNNDPPAPSFSSGSAKKRLRLMYFLPIHTPDYFSYTTIIAGNSASEGLLHLLIRHGNELVRHGLSKDILSVLPFGMRKIVDLLRNENTKQRNGEFMNELIQMSDADFSKLFALQDEAWKLIQRTVDYMGERINVNGQQQVYWRVNSQWTMVTAPSKELYLEMAEMQERKKRPIRKIVTVFFNEMADFEKKKRDDWPITKNQNKP